MGLRSIILFLLALGASAQEYSFTRVVDNAPGSAVLGFIPPVLLNNTGEVAFTGAPRANPQPSAIRITNGQPVVLASPAIPFSMNDAGEVVLVDQAIRVVRSPGNQRVVLDSVLPEMGTLTAAAPSINNDGIVAFSTSRRILIRRPGGALETLVRDDELPRARIQTPPGLWVGHVNDAGTVSMIATDVPEGVGLFTKGPGGLQRIPLTEPQVLSPPLNNTGQTVYIGKNQRGATLVIANTAGAALVAEDSPDLQILNSPPGINNRGDVVFAAQEVRTRISGLYSWSQGRVRKVIAPADPLFGSTVVRIEVGDLSRRCINDRGEIAFIFRLTNGLEGVGIATPSFTSVAPPVVPSNGLVNAASFQSSVSPGSIVSIFGQGLAPNLTQSAGAPLPRSLGGVRVLFDNMEAPLFFVAPGQINAQVPFELAGSTAQVRVVTATGESEPRSVVVAPESPSLYTLSQNGSGAAIAVFANSATLVAAVGFTSDSRPARPGDIITLYANGLGPVTPSIGSGENSCPDSRCAPGLANVILRRCVTTPVVQIGDVIVPPSDILFAGLAPEFVGLFQINLRIPASVRPLPTLSAAPLVLRQGTRTSQANVFLPLL